MKKGTVDRVPFLMLLRLALCGVIIKPIEGVYKPS